MTSTATMMRVHAPGGPLTADQVEVDSPPDCRVAIEVVASGLCRADLATAAAPGATELPVTPGHEVAGTVAELGPGVEGWRIGERVARLVRWQLRALPGMPGGDVVHCPERRIPGISYPGGWTSRLLAPAGALARIPDGLGFADAAPMGCARVTAFSAVRGAGAPAGGRIAVFGVGGLGHFAVQFAAKTGHEVVAIACGPEREEIARELGANEYIDSAATPPGQALRALGGVDAIISTASATEQLVGGLRPRGRLVLVGVDAGSPQLPVAPMVMRALSVTGHLTGSPADTEQAMEFAVLGGIRPMTQTYPMEQAQTALEALRDGEARFRLVLDATMSAAGRQSRRRSGLALRRRGAEPRRRAGAPPRPSGPPPRRPCSSIRRPPAVRNPLTRTERPEP